jgi:hypothetical protein
MSKRNKNFVPVAVIKPGPEPELNPDRETDAAGFCELKKGLASIGRFFRNIFNANKNAAAVAAAAIAAKELKDAADAEAFRNEIKAEILAASVAEALLQAKKLEEAKSLVALHEANKAHLLSEATPLFQIPLHQNGRTSYGNASMQTSQMYPTAHAISQIQPVVKCREHPKGNGKFIDHGREKDCKFCKGYLDYLTSGALPTKRNTCSPQFGQPYVQPLVPPQTGQQLGPLQTGQPKTGLQLGPPQASLHIGPPQAGLPQAGLHIGPPQAGLPQAGPPQGQPQGPQQGPPQAGTPKARSKKASQPKVRQLSQPQDVFCQNPQGCKGCNNVIFHQNIDGKQYNIYCIPCKTKDCKDLECIKIRQDVSGKRVVCFQIPK